MLSAFIYERKVSKVEFSIEKLKQLLNKKGITIWIDLHNPTKKEHQQVKDLFNIHPLVIEDCSKTHTRPKIELYKDYNFIVTNGIHYNQKDLSILEFDFIIGRNFIISNHFGPAEHIEQLKHDTQRLEHVMPKGADFMLHAIIDREVDNFFPFLDMIEDELEGLEDSILKNPSPAVLKSVLNVKKHLLTLRKSTIPMREVVGILAKRDYPFLSQEAEAYFRDVYDHLIRINDMTDSFRDIVSSTTEIHLSVVSNKLNEVMKVLTVIATIMLPLTVVTGIYGMNFENQPEFSWRYGYFFSLGLMALIAITMLLYFRRKGWI